MTEPSEPKQDEQENRTFQSTRRRFLGVAAVTGAVASVGAMRGSNESRADVAAAQSGNIDPVYGYPVASADSEPPVEPDHEVSLSIEPAEGREIPEFLFDPVGVAVQTGDVVMFTMESGSHTVTAYHPDHQRTPGVPEEVPPYSSPLMAPGSYWLYRFDQAGVHDVYCLPHEQFGMVARIVVESNGGATENGGIPGILPGDGEGDSTPTANATEAGTATDEPLFSLQQGQEIQLGGETQAWMGRAPAEIEGQSNPTLSLTAGQRYSVTWENVDGVPHNFAIVSGNGDTLVSSEIMSEQGTTQTVNFEATEAMAEYLCEVHPNSMRGSIELGTGGGTETETGTATGTATETGTPTEAGTGTPSTGTGTPTGTPTGTEMGTPTGTPTEDGEEIPLFPPAPAAQRVLSDPALAPDNIVEQGEVAWNELSAEARGFPPKGPDYVATLNGDNQVPPVDTPATGEATFFVTDRGYLRYHVVAHDIEGVTAAHIHNGGPDETGPIVIPLFSLTGESGSAEEGQSRSASGDQPFEMTGVIRDSDFVGLVTNPPENLTGGFYVNVHTEANPAGEIRGQLQQPDEASGETPLDGGGTPEATPGADSAGEATPGGNETAAETPDEAPSGDETPEGETSGGASEGSSANSSEGGQ